MVSAFSWLVSCATLLPAVEGHGYMVNPNVRSRNGKFKYEPQSLGAVGPGGAITICGRDGAENFKTKDTVTKLPAPGSKYKITAKITAHHFGHMIVRVCKFIDGSTSHKDLKNSCIRLKSTGGKPVWPLSANTGVKTWDVQLPSKKELLALGTKKGVYTIQWRWNTANSCKASENVEDEGSNCNEKKCCSEVFTNCADVVFEGLPSDPPKPAENPPKPRPSPAPPSGSGSSGGKSGCGREDDCAASAWCNDDTYVGWCRMFKSEDACTEHVQCRWGGAGGGGSKGPKPEPEPEPEPKGEPHGKHVMTVTKEAKAAGLKKVAEFCKANKDYFCDHVKPPEVGNELCDCSPDDESEPESEPESESEPEGEPKAETPKTKGGKTNCDDFKKWCQKNLQCRFKHQNQPVLGSGTVHAVSV